MRNPETEKIPLYIYTHIRAVTDCIEIIEIVITKCCCKLLRTAGLQTNI